MITKLAGAAVDMAVDPEGVVDKFVSGSPHEALQVERNAVVLIRGQTHLDRHHDFRVALVMIFAEPIYYGLHVSLIFEADGEVDEAGS